MTENKTIQIDYDKWFKKYKPVQNIIVKDSSYDNTMFETYGEELEYILSLTKNSNSNQYVWTLINGEYEETWIIPGYHIINRLGYFVTEKKWEDENIEVNDNETITINKAITSCIKFFKDYGYSFDKYSVTKWFEDFISEYSNNLYTIGKAKYTVISYYEYITGNELTGEQEDNIHDYYSQLN